MNIETAKKYKISQLLAAYKRLKPELNKSTIKTRKYHVSYLETHLGKEKFWNLIDSPNFDQDARDAIRNVLKKSEKKDSKTQEEGKEICSACGVDKATHYRSHLKNFREFIRSDLEDMSSVEKIDMTVLMDFLLNVDCLDPLSEWINKFNLFEILKISRKELIHSNLLAWLLNPKENHGLGNSVLVEFIRQYHRDMTHEEMVEAIGKDFDIRREEDNIDILVVSKDKKIVLCIENKIDSKEHDDQLNHYKSQVEREYSDFQRMYIYLTPEGEDSSDPDNWCSMGYQEVLKILEDSRLKNKPLPEADFLIQNYIDTIRKEIVADENIIRICTDVYRAHEEALDLIYENRSDIVSASSEEVAGLCKKVYTKYQTALELLYEYRPKDLDKEDLGNDQYKERTKETQ